MVHCQADFSEDAYAAHHFNRNIRQADVEATPAKKSTRFPLRLDHLPFAPKSVVHPALREGLCGRLMADHAVFSDGSLPFSPDASVFVCVDEERLDVMKVCPWARFAATLRIN